ncbi:MAG: hypothetical protein N2447_06725 [Thermoanaerobaculum sp.]|nr:hypothetical protein [Thermoanaerobaculum sp.]
MPLYEYACSQCGVHTEVMQRVDAPPLAACPSCGGPVRKVFAPPALQFKGSGWYITDYARAGNGSKRQEESKGGEGSNGSASSSTKSTDQGSSTGTTAGSSDKG